MAKPRRHAPRLNTHIFINCPFDDDYDACLSALVFTITLCGYEARCALEDDDTGNVRLDKLCELIGDSDRSIHDLSRTTTGPSGLPRFNMPFELGLTMGAQRFRPSRKSRKLLVMVSKQFEMPKYLSDLAGNDPKVHNDDPRRDIAIVRDHLHTDPDGQPLAGGHYYADLFDEFRTGLPDLAKRANLDMAEVHVRRGYRNHMDMVRVFRDLLLEAAEE